jgi:hypothetical protein
MPLERAKQLQDSIAWLSNYKGSEKGIEDQIGNSNAIEERDEHFTKLLHRLGELNKEREEILKEFAK